MKKIISVLIIASCILASCSKGYDSVASDFTEDVVSYDASGNPEISFAAGEVTKVTAVTTSNLSTMYVNAVTGTLGSSESSAFNTMFYKNGTKFYGGSSSSSTNPQYWPASNPSYKFYGSNISITAASSGATISPTNSTDVVAGVIASPTYLATNAFTLNHVFGRLSSVTTEATSGYTISNITLTIVPKTGGTYKINAGTWSSTTDGSATSIANSSLGTKSNDIYLVPGTYTVTAGWKAVRGSYSETFSNVTSKSITIVAGKTNTVTVQFGGSASEIDFTVTVSDWSANDNQTITYPN